VEYETYETFNLRVPKSCPNVPDEMLNPAKSWTGKADFKAEVAKLGTLFIANFKKYADEATEEVIKAGKCTSPSGRTAEGLIAWQGPWCKKGGRCWPKQ
jgi:phosphoenolpyruvate carboxykinase (ATP)